MVGLQHSETQHAPLNAASSGLILPELSNNKIGGNFAFGLNNKLNYDEMSDI
jgi:hypothetical protein